MYMVRLHAVFVCITHILRIYAVLMLNMLCYICVFITLDISNIYNVDTLYMRFMPYLSMHNPYIRSTYAKYACYC